MDIYYVEQNVKYSPDVLLTESDKAKFYDLLGNTKGFLYGDDIYINNANTKQDKDLTETLTHETYHKENNINNKAKEEALAMNYGMIASEMLDKYYGNNSQNSNSYFTKENNIFNDFDQTTWASGVRNSNANDYNVAINNNYILANQKDIKESADFLTIFVHGTNSSPNQADPEFIKALEETFGEKVEQIDWSKDGFMANNNKESRLIGAKELLELINAHEFKEGELLNIIDHSHGGNVVKLFTQLYGGEKEIDTLVFLGTPHRADYQLDYSDLAPNANKINVYDVNDGVQIRGGMGSDSYSTAQFILNSFKSSIIIQNPANRTIDKFNNIGIEQTRTQQYWDWKSGQITNNQIPLGLVNSHLDLDSAPVWNQYVKPQIRK